MSKNLCTEFIGSHADFLFDKNCTEIAHHVLIYKNKLFIRLTILGIGNWAYWCLTIAFELLNRCNIGP
jgi:hypothetical protein